MVKTRDHERMGALEASPVPIKRENEIATEGEVLVMKDLGTGIGSIRRVDMRDQRNVHEILKDTGTQRGLERTGTEEMMEKEMRNGKGKLVEIGKVQSLIEALNQEEEMLRKSRKEVDQDLETGLENIMLQTSRGLEQEVQKEIAEEKEKGLILEIDLLDHHRDIGDREPHLVPMKEMTEFLEVAEMAVEMVRIQDNRRKGTLKEVIKSLEETVVMNHQIVREFIEVMEELVREIREMIKALQPTVIASMKEGRSQKRREEGIQAQEIGIVMELALKTIELENHLETEGCDLIQAAVVAKV